MADKKQTLLPAMVVWNQLGPVRLLSDGVPFPSTADVRVDLVDETFKGGLSLRLVLEVIDGEPVLTGVAIATKKGDPTPITSTTLRDLDLTTIVDQVGDQLARRAAGGPHGLMPDEDATTRIDERFGERRRRPLTEANLREVADLYAEGAGMGKPTRHVADQLPTSYRNASRWIAEAKRRGFITRGEG